MDLVDEQHVVLVQVGQQCGQVAGLLDHRSRRLAQVDAQFVGDHVAERGLAQAGRAEDQHVVERFAALLRRLDVDRHLLAHRRLAEVFVEAPGTYRRFDGVFFARGSGGNDAVVHAGIMARRDGIDMRPFQARRSAS